jgi:acetoin utilization protein AcuB
MMGILTASSRIDVAIGSDPDSFRAALKIINDNGGDVINVGMTAEQNKTRVYYFRLAPCKTDVIKKALHEKGFKVLDAMD